MDFDLVLKILGIVTGAFVGYHRFIVKLVDKKLDKVFYESDQKHLKEAREFTDKTLFKKIEVVEEKIDKLHDNIIEILKIK